MATRLIRADHMTLWHCIKLGDYDTADEFINQCTLDPHGECTECSWICCPHGDELHFHHDGCPSCAQAEENHEST